MNSVFSIVLFCLFTLTANVQAAVDQTPEPSTMDVQKSKSDILEDLLQTYFTYQREGRTDPFKTFIKKEVPKATVESGGTATEEEVLSGMQLFEPGQLKLVSIVFAGDQGFAMVQDSVGQGYVIEKGTKIGRRGVVEDIIENVVLIRQWSKTFAGQKKYKTIEMVLRKEGE